PRARRLSTPLARRPRNSIGFVDGKALRDHTVEKFRLKRGGGRFIFGSSRKLINGDNVAITPLTYDGLLELPIL
ncbi:hypothetical protein KKF91_14165, partial [Myxococcota bacterium]|nr:hypothetical protein [Myxococcota bacterium]